ncbi:MAG: CBS domain-containing protein [Deltaproteobacteria bacterium]|nr:CBS domain-containing protein [Deltaproteobacteria bacterium]
MSESPITIGSKQSMASAAKLMKEHSIRHLPVLRGGQLVGVVSDRDVKIVESFADVDPETVSVDEAVSQEAYAVAPSEDLGKVVRHMHDHKYGSAVVMEGKKVVGIFTTIDALSALADTLGAKA